MQASSRTRGGIAATFPTLVGAVRDRVPPRILAIAAAALIAGFVLIVFIIPRCTSAERAEGQSTPAIVEQQATSSQVGSQTGDQASGQDGAQSIKPDKGDVRQEGLIKLIGEEETSKLFENARTNPEALWIAAHPDRYAFDGLEVQYKILKLAADEPAAISFVREFPTLYPSAEVKSDESLALDTHSPNPDIPDTKVPHLYQWDRRWGNTVYSSAAFGLTGCGPTSFAMVYQGVTGKTDKNPYDFAKIAEKGNYMATYEGTSNAFFSDMADEYGMSYEELYPTPSNITSALSNGKVIVANLGKGLFTEHGHFFVLAGLTDDGKVIINDPYSLERSSQTWDADTIAAESVVLHAYSRKA